MSYRVTFAYGHAEIISHPNNHQPPFQSKDVCSDCQENAFYMVLNLWESIAQIVEWLRSIGGFQPGKGKYIYAAASR
jgi:hypothetical protein